MTPPTLGIAIIMQNERHHIPTAISQFYFIMDQIVVVDGGSKDDSVEWAERMGATVLHRPFENDYASQKNFAISKLSTDWVYLHDPDERLEPTFINLIPRLISLSGQVGLSEAGVIPGLEEGELFDCFGIARRNYIDGEITEVYPDYQYRLFRNYCRFEGKVRETIFGFKHRTELDYTHTSLDDQAGFNILHYKSSTRQTMQDKLYEQLIKENG